MILPFISCETCFIAYTWQISWWRVEKSHCNTAMFGQNLKRWKVTLQQFYINNLKYYHCYYIVYIFSNVSEDFSKEILNHLHLFRGWSLKPSEGFSSSFILLVGSLRWWLIVATPCQEAVYFPLPQKCIFSLHFQSVAFECFSHSNVQSDSVWTESRTNFKSI